MTDARILAKATGAATRMAEGVNALGKLTEDLPHMIHLQANAVIEEFDLLRYYLRAETLRTVIGPKLVPNRAAGAKARNAKLSAEQRVKAATKAVKARWAR